MATNVSNDEDVLKVKKSQILYNDLSVALVRPQPAWDSDRDRLLRSVDDHLLYLYETQKLCDLVVTNGEKKFNIHRVVLAAQSPKYRQVFSDTASPLPTEVAVSGVSAEVLTAVLRYLYTGRLTLTAGNVTDVLGLAAQLDLPALLDDGRQLLLKYDEETVLKYLLLARRHGFEDLAVQLGAFAARRFAAVSQQPEFLALTADAVVAVLSREDARQGLGEAGLLKAAVRWLQAAEPDGSRRDRHAAAVLGCVKLERVPPAVLMEAVEKNSSLADVPEVSFMLYEAYKHHALAGEKEENRN